MIYWHCCQYQRDNDDDDDDDGDDGGGDDDATKAWDLSVVLARSRVDWDALVMLHTAYIGFMIWSWENIADYDLMKTLNVVLRRK